LTPDPGSGSVDLFHNGKTYNIDLVRKDGPTTEEPLSIAWVSEPPHAEDPIAPKILRRLHLGNFKLKPPTRP
jgi:hypothetical protein